jgi:hypothetical protein
MRVQLPAVAIVAASLVACLAACQAGELYEACDGATDCEEGLRCVDLGGDQRLCTRPCSVEKRRAGYPEGLDDDALFTDGGSAQATVKDPQCADAAIDVTSQDDPDQAAQDIAIESKGTVGVCRVAATLVADQAISGDSILTGFCAPL